jgi:broad specificity phosphatase PhoE
MIVVCRHGRTAHNAAARLLGRLDVPLDEVGAEQARAVAATVGPVDRVVSSPLLRARQTADAFGVPVEVDERWIELDYGGLDGTPLADVPPDVWAAWRRDPGFRPPGGETLAELGTRVRHALDDLVEEAADSTVVVVTHVSPIKAAVAWALGVGDEVSWRIFIGQASISRIAVGPRGPVLQSCNEVAHLER